MATFESQLTGKAPVKQFDYYALNKVDKCDLDTALDKALAALHTQTWAEAEASTDFVKKIFTLADVKELLVYLSRLPVFSKEFAETLSSNLDLLAIAKKLKYFTNLPLGQNALLVQQAAQCLEKPLPNFAECVEKLCADRALSDIRLKDFMKQNKETLPIAKEYLENDDALEKIDPHAVYPTSIYRHCDGCTLASPDSKSIEAVMSTTITTTIKITRGILDPKNKLLADYYRPLGRCVAVIDDKVEKIYGETLNKYFQANNIEIIQLIHGGNEIDKDIRSVEKILVDLKNNGVARNEPVLVMGGGVIADTAGFATALYHRNTPYVMLCTSIVTGIDAGPSPRTCCDGFGFKNLYGAYHPPVLTLTDRYFWKSLHEGWIRHGIAEIIKMACVKDKSLFELVEKAGPRLIRTKFGTEGCDDDADFQDLCDNIVGKAMEGYVRSEYGNLWETHQCRPHAFGHTWSPGYELPAGLLHGHAVATCMGYGSYLAYIRDWISKADFERILSLISTMELSLWHDIMDNHELVAAANKKAHQKRGGNLCAPVPRHDIGVCGYINDHTREDVTITMNDYKKLVNDKYPRGGRGIDVHCHDVGLEDPSTVAGDALASIGQAPGKQRGAQEVSTSYMEWIKTQQTERNQDWESNVDFGVAADTAQPPSFEHYQLFNDGAELYARQQTTCASDNVQKVAKITAEKNQFQPCMVGTLESQFLKMQAQIKGAKNCLDVGTFTGMSAIAFAEGIPVDGKVHTLENSDEVAKIAQEAFSASSVRDKVVLHVGDAKASMEKLKADGVKFDIIFLDADKENYIAYYDIAMSGLLAEGGIILADNSLCALLYDQTDVRSTKLHEFNQHVKNDKRVEQVMLTIREGITLIRPVQK